ncbi:MAG: polya polymerase [Clostridia bacterium]|nr:polya polymerase [Clostridia bacterium]
MASDQAIAEEFSRIMRECKGKVIFVTEEGDRLVADSMLSALVGLSNLLSMADEFSMHVECEYPEDCDRILNFMKKYKLGRHR